ncbi:MAG TPA: carbon-nitrogen hydrolase family protein [Firmicutes bacterium]|nr:carbon-nitrogen hydrolase family protein [Bacillota bacterium]
MPPKGGAVIKVAVIQLNASSNKEDNLKKALSLIEQAAAGNPSVVALPEYFSYMGPENTRYDQAEPIPGPTTRQLARAAQQYQIYLLGGSILERSPYQGRCYNTSVLFNPDGQIIAIYRKIYLFDIITPGGVLSRESLTIIPGKEKVVADTPLGKWGLTTCFDLRFPMLYRELTLNGAWLIFVPSAFSLHTGKDHWEVLLRARAIENRVYIVAPGQIGHHPPNFRTYGNSMIIDPWGTVLARAPEEEGVIGATLSLERLERIRSKMPGPKLEVEDRPNQPAG